MKLEPGLYLDGRLLENFWCWWHVQSQTPLSEHPGQADGLHANSFKAYRLWESLDYDPVSLLATASKQSPRSRRPDSKFTDNWYWQFPPGSRYSCGLHERGFALQRFLVQSLQHKFFPRNSHFDSFSVSPFKEESVLAWLPRGFNEPSPFVFLISKCVDTWYLSSIIYATRSGPGGVVVEFRWNSKIVKMNELKKIIMAPTQRNPMGGAGVENTAAVRLGLVRLGWARLG